MYGVLGEYPDLLDELLAAGARKLTFEDMVPDHLTDQYQPESGDEKLWMLLCRRATIETVLRHYVARELTCVFKARPMLPMSSSRMHSQCQATNSHRHRPRLTDRHNQNTKSTHSADIIINASGRADKFYQWLRHKGAEIVEQRDDAEIVYYTRHYALNEGVSEPKRDSENPSAGDLGYLKYGVFPGDNGHFAIIVCLPNDETELREAVKDGDKFNQICMNIPGLVPWMNPAAATPTTAPFGIGEIHAVWRDYIPSDESPKLLNYFAVGDAQLAPIRSMDAAAARAPCMPTYSAKYSAVSQILGSEHLLSKPKPKKKSTIFNASLNEDKNGIKPLLLVKDAV